MKKYIVKLLLFMGLLSTLFACDDFLNQENPNKTSVDAYFQNENDVERALNGAYQSIRTNYLLGERSTSYTEERSDNMGRLDNQSSSGEPFQFTDFSLLPSNTYLKNHWSAHYESISKTNFALYGIETITFADEEKQNRYKSEALFLRALVYFQLVRKWGDVPLVVTYLFTTDEIKAHTFREKKEVVYNQIVKDLTEALNSNLPNHQPVSGKGKASKAAINGLLGQVYLTMYTTLEEGDKQTYLNNAKKYLLDAYTMRDFTQLSEIPYADVFDVEKKSTNPEIIFQIVYIQGDKDYYSSVAQANQAKGETINSLYKSTGSGTFVNPDLVKEYEEGDLRKEWSVKYATNAVALNWFITKFRDASADAGSLGYGGNDWIVMRYADIILMLSEVEMYLGNNTAAISYLNQVRERALMPSYEAMQTNAAYKEKYPTLQLALLHERRVELAFENHRWYDLLRFFSSTELVQYMHAKDQDDYGISNLLNFGSKDIYYPIPFDEVKLDPEKMYQNPGY